MGLFDKKYCDVCGEKIGLLGNRKLEDGNLCKDCAKKLSPWFDERRHSTLEQIKEQLAYREDNQQVVDEFQVSRSYGEHERLLIDDARQAFMIVKSKNYREDNPDVVSFSQVTGCNLKIDEDRTEEKRKDKDGNSVSFNPPRYTYYYTFYVTVHVNSPWFSEMKMRLNDNRVMITSEQQRGFGFLGGRLTDHNAACQNYIRMGEEIQDALTGGRDAAAAASEPTGTIACPYCGAMTKAASFCEYCGGSLK